jgi:hypothetical protein
VALGRGITRIALMSTELPRVYLVRHGETAWSLSGQATGRTDIPLTERGEREAQALAARPQGSRFAGVFTSPSSACGTMPGTDGAARVREIGIP